MASKFLSLEQIHERYEDTSQTIFRQQQEKIRLLSLAPQVGAAYSAKNFQVDKSSALQETSAEATFANNKLAEKRSVLGESTRTSSTQSEPFIVSKLCIIL